ncbi:hypothetical protein [Geothrix fermentans]|uniref:hypothetical protein n=1 Tax=Geothrix fermentans TaxID=44676 RepID=UPI00047C8232|nr:hypothetical protein [Geothrix fermentans]
MYIPVEFIDPPEQLQVTAVLVVPVTVAVNCCVLFIISVVEFGLTDTTIELGPPAEHGNQINMTTATTFKR